MNITTIPLDKDSEEEKEAKGASERMDSDYDYAPIHISLSHNDGSDDEDSLVTSSQDRVVKDDSSHVDQSDTTHERHDAAFRADFFRNHRLESAMTYERYQPAYHYGNELAWDRHLGDLSDWSEVAEAAQRGWDETRYGPWEQFSEAVRFAWDRIHNGASLTELD